jgi:enoyl-CoA hydratase/carnithine racemase
VHLVLLDAEGPAFCAGMDLKSVDLADPDQASPFAAALSDVYLRMLTLPKLLLCAVDGPVSGGGVGLPAAADVTWVGPRATFALPETRLGLVPALVSVPLRRRVGARVLKQMALGGLTLDAQESVDRGLADHAAPAGAGQAAVDFAERHLRDHAPGALSRTKRFLARHDAAGLEAELREARVAFEEAGRGEEARRGLEAFRAKEVVSWRAS